MCACDERAQLLGEVRIRVGEEDGHSYAKVALAIAGLVWRGLALGFAQDDGDDVSGRDPEGDKGQ